MIPRSSWLAGDVEEAEFVGARGVIGDRGFHRVAGVAQIDEIDALDHPAVLDVEAWDDADLEQTPPLLRACVADEAQRIGRIELASIQRAARDRAGQLPGARFQQLVNVADRREPPDAITGMSTVSASATVASRFSPLRMPSREISV